jgi:signal transduction histidine kinase
MKVDFSYDDAVIDRFRATSVDDMAALAIYRITEQALQNVLKHGRAGDAHVTLELLEAERYRLEVTAGGMPPDGDSIPGNGTLIIDSWLGEVGGSWELSPALGGGSRFVAMIGGKSR